MTALFGLVAAVVAISLPSRAFAAEADCVATAGAYLRAEPTSASRAVTAVSFGRLAVQGRKGGWVQVEVPGHGETAYIPSSVCRPLTSGETVGPAVAGFAGSVRTTVVEASKDEKPKGEKKGGFWKKLGKGLLIGAVVAASAYAASKGGYVAQPTAGDDSEESSEENAPPVYAASSPRPDPYTRPATSTYTNLYSGLTGSRQRVGGFTYYNFSNGVSGSSQRIGAFTYHNFSNGVSGSTQRIGAFTYHNFSNGVSGSSQSIGDFTYTNYSNGVSGTSQRIGDFEYTNYNDGTSCTTQTIGSQEYTNCQ